MKCYLDEENDVIKTGENIVIKNCIETIGKISGLKCINYADQTMKNCPSLPPLTIGDIEYIRQHLSKNKAITFDGFTEEWFLKT